MIAKLRNHAPAARRAALFLGAAVLLLLLTPDLAHAQVGGSGGSGVVNQIVQWFMQNIARGLVMIGIFAVAIMLFVMRFSAGTIASVVAGGLILANADSIAGFFGF